MKNINNKINWILQEKYNGELTNKAKIDIERLKKGEPLDYIIGFVNFLGCKIDLSKRPLIPRVETGYWTDIAIKELKNQNRKLKILDMFSGSGCIGISIMRHIGKATVVFADSQNNCIEQIKINCKINMRSIFSSLVRRNKINFLSPLSLENKINKKRYKIIQSDVFKNVEGKFDYIFANPPYIPIKRKNKIQKSVLEYEPKEALFGGKEGFFYIRKFLASAKDFLNDEGRIYMEFDSIQKKEIEKLLRGLDYKNFKFYKDQYNKWRYVVINNCGIIQKYS